MLSTDDIQTRLQAAFPDAQVVVRDTTGTSDHFEAVVVSASFEGMTRIKQHQAVYAALGDAMKGEIHALALRTFTPDRWKRELEG